MDFGELCLDIARIAKVSRRCATTRIADQTKCDNFVEPKAQAATLNFDAARRVLVEPDLVKQGLGRQRHFSWEKRDMKRFGSNLFWQSIKVAGVGAALMMSVSAGNAQSGPFAGFDGTWSGNGTVSLSDGSTERIRCRATYKVDGSGSGLQQSLRCASDSYKFDLSSNVTTQGPDRIIGTWNEASRNINGNLQGRAGGGQIEVVVEAAGFAATLNLTTRGNKQSVSISSKGEIRGVSINMARGG